MSKWDAQKERDLATALFIATAPHPAEVKQKVIEIMWEAGHIVNWDATRYVNCIDMSRQHSGLSLLWEFPKPSLVVVPLGGSSWPPNYFFPCIFPLPNTNSKTCHHNFRRAATRTTSPKPSQNNLNPHLHSQWFAGKTFATISSTR